MKDTSESDDQLERIIDWMRREKALTCAGVGALCFLISLFGGHLDERITFVMEVLSVIALGFAIKYEEQPVGRTFYALILGASLIFIVMDFNLSSHLSQMRDLESFDAK
ncbi:hypothetical protein [Kozakia baliensis]|uniref:Uncharacterized protein n=1 Tax=Kozakia baliensis TaxID=153496 RepID=A0A1D8UUA1_9PROT|nr:hypothetical protein [Kozakia baliensis]AOX17230.1 hypothetical protein A0U89_08910 [Kozakia baliensis]GBR29716.1 hypothetical protein AA0488_1786 [Kozakia baliensis NRIC 0488]GEL63353.1 hypothetical protein KBA01_06390 [Kozakia baliensis]